MLAFRWCTALAVAATLAKHGLAKKSLSESGAIAAFVVGLLSWGCGVRFGLTLILFYYASSKLTKYKAKVKRRLEDDYREGGQRDAKQVLSCSGFAVVLAVLYSFTGRVAGAPVDHFADKGGAFVLCAYLGFFACCCGDTWASELGVLDPRPFARLTVWPFSRVPKGTNGAISSNKQRIWKLCCNDRGTSCSNDDQAFC